MMTRSKALTLLGVPKDSTFDEALAAYKRARKELHPDQYHDKPHLRATAENALKDVNSAWDFLKHRRWSGPNTEKESERYDSQPNSDAGQKEERRRHEDEHREEQARRQKEEKNTFDLNSAWRSIEAISPPGPDPLPLAIPTTPSGEASQLGLSLQQQSKNLYLWWGGLSCLAICLNLAVGLLVSLLTYWVIFRTKIKKIAAGRDDSIEAALTSTQAAYESLTRVIQEQGCEASFRNEKNKLENIRSEYQDLPKMLEKRLEEQMKENFLQQRRDYLRLREIRPGVISGIGIGNGKGYGSSGPRYRQCLRCVELYPREHL